MRLSAPRITPSESHEWDADQRALMAKMERGVGPVNVIRTLVRHEKLLRRWLPFANHLLFKSTLAARDREILILRTAWNTQAVYEWGQHVVIARRAGLSEAEIARIKAGAEAEGWSEAEGALITVADELIADKMLSDEAWAGLAAHYSTQQVLDAIFTVGNYTAVAMAVIAIGVQLDEGLERF